MSRNDVTAAHASKVEAFRHCGCGASRSSGVRSVKMSMSLRGEAWQ